MQKPTHILKTSLQRDTYVLDGCIAGTDAAAPQLIVSTSESYLKQYDCRRFAHVRDIRGHTGAITDVVAHGDMVVSCQSDTGVMITDLRMQQPAHFLSELRSEGMQGNTVAVNPSGTALAVAAGMNVHIVDPRTWSGIKVVKEAHCDDVTKLRFVTDSLFVSGGDDHMINFYDSALPDKDALRCTVNAGECLNRITVMPELGLVGASGSCETAYLFALPANLATDDFPPEITLRRGEDFARYCVDWIGVNGTAYLVTGRNTAFDAIEAMDDPKQQELGPAAQPLALHSMPPADLSLSAPALQLSPAHSDIVRLALVVGNTNRMVTAGEDGSIAVWATNAGAGGGGDGREGEDEDDGFSAGSDAGNGSGGVSESSGPGRMNKGGRQRAHNRKSALPF